MWSEPKDAAYIHEMIERLSQIEQLVGDEEQDRFLTDLAAPHALALHLLVLGEAANKLSDGFKLAFPSIEWRKIINLRHLIAHEYRKIDHTELWRIAVEDVPRLTAALPPLPQPKDIF